MELVFILILFLSLQINNIIRFVSQSLPSICDCSSHFILLSLQLSAQEEERMTETVR